MNKQSTIFLFLGFLGFLSATSRAECQTQPITFKIAESFETNHTIYLSEIADKVDYIKLETTDESVMGMTNKVYMNENNLLVYSGKLMAFDTLGKFQKVVARKGRGPGEFVEFGGISFDGRTGDYFLANRVGRSVLRFNNQNNFVENYGKQDGFRVLRYKDDLICNFFPIRWLAGSDFYSLVIKNNQGAQVDRTLQQQKSLLRHYSRLPGQNSSIYYYRDSVTIWDGFNDTIMRWSSDFNVTPAFVLDLGELKLPFKMKSGASMAGYRKEANEYGFIISVKETQNYVFLDCVNKNTFLKVICDKTSGKCLSTPEARRMPNDIDGGIKFWPHGVTADGRLYMVIDPNWIYYWEQDTAKVAAKDREAEKKLLSLFENCDLEDNPIVMLVTLK